MTTFIKCYHDLVDKLSEDEILAEVIFCFGTFECVYERLKFIDEVVKKYFREPKCQPHSKNNVESTKLRNLGNSHFATADYLMALKLYNESVCYAENDSEEMSLAFANRSAIYFKFGLYDDCLKSIGLAKKATYPVRLMDKLNERETLCLEQCKDNVNPKYTIEPELSFPANPQVPFVVNCLELKNTQYGRQLITTSDLKAGDVVAIEESFCSSLPKELRYMRCENCLIENNQNLIPCTRCTSVMFCGDKCCDEAYTKFHKFECPIIGYIASMAFNNSLLAVRTLICAITSFNSPDELISFVEETRGEDLTVFNCNFDNKAQNAYGPVHFLREDDTDIKEEFAFSISASLIYQALLKRTELSEMFTTEKAIEVFKELVLHIVKIMIINGSETILSIATDSSQKIVANSCHPFRSILSHSCAPNVDSSSFGKKIVFTILRPIAAGEQLFENYGCHFAANTLIERQKKLDKLKCQCTACENKYPLYPELPSGTIPKLQIEETEEETMTIESMQQFKYSYADYMNKYAVYYPCQELVQAEGLFQLYLEATYKEEMPVSTRFK